MAESPTGTILFAHPEALQRLMLEGGVSSSFLGLFTGQSVFDTVEESGRIEPGLDELIATRPLVAIDERLLGPADGPLAPAETLRRYRDNFLRKIASRRQVRLSIVDGTVAEQVSMIESLGRPPVPSEDAEGWQRADVVLVLGSELTAETSAAITALLKSAAVNRVYLMARRLQSGRAKLNLALADHVWPVCVARLLVVLANSTDGDRRSGDQPANLIAWRTFTWGTAVGNGDGLSQWMDKYRTALRDALLPSTSHSADMPRQLSLDEATASVNQGDTSPLPVFSLAWRDDAESLHVSAVSPVSHDVVADLINKTAEKAEVQREAIDHAGLVQSVGDAWTLVKSEDGLVRLRSMRDGRLWPSRDVTGGEAQQSATWRQVSDRRRRLENSLIEHRHAAAEVVLARQRFLPTAWRVITAGAVGAFLLQFLLAVMLPLRPVAPSTPADGPPLMGLPLDRQSVAFLVDRSSTMAGHRLSKLRDDLSAAIASLPAGTRFNVVALGDDFQVMPGGESGLVEATADAKAVVGAWLATLKPTGLTRALPAIQQLLGLSPDHIVLLTDGQLMDASDVLDFLRAEATQALPKVDTISLFSREGEEALSGISNATGGSYQFVAFDPFAPYGYRRVVLTLCLCGLLGVLIGTIAPWWLEYRAGTRAVEHLRIGLMALHKEVRSTARALGRVMTSAAGVSAAKRLNEMASLQQTLATRALRAVEAVLDGPTGSRDRSVGSVARSSPQRPEPLVAEDRRELFLALDEPLPTAPEEDGMASEMSTALSEIVASHATILKNNWSRLCERHDIFSSGHIPLAAIESEFAHAVRHLSDAATSKEIWWRAKRVMESDVNQKKYQNLADDLRNRLTDESHRPFLSCPVETHGSRLPRPTFRWLGVHPIEHEEKWLANATELLLQHLKVGGSVAIKHEIPVREIGVSAVGLVHEELVVTLVKGPNATHRIEAVRSHA